MIDCSEDWTAVRVTMVGCVTRVRRVASCRVVWCVRARRCVVCGVRALDALARRRSRTHRRHRGGGDACSFVVVRARPADPAPIPSRSRAEASQPILLVPLLLAAASPPLLMLLLTPLTPRAVSPPSCCPSPRDGDGDGDGDDDVLSCLVTSPALSLRHAGRRRRDDRDAALLRSARRRPRVRVDGPALRARRGRDHGGTGRPGRVAPRLHRLRARPPKGGTPCHITARRATSWHDMTAYHGHRRRARPPERAVRRLRSFEWSQSPVPRRRRRARNGACARRADPHGDLMVTSW